MHRADLNIRQRLRGVSRSFGLSIGLLPAALREPVGLAYLLARITDTVADTAAVPAARRLALLDRLQQAIEQPLQTPSLAPALQDFARQVDNAPERALLAQGQACLEALARQSGADQAVMRAVLAAIIEGQHWDLAALDGTQRGVATSAELERYTWLVAGSVGEFWTRMCELHVPHWHKAQLAELMHWGARYGQGLQRLNILRDAGADLRAGRCYFPQDELAPLGLDRERLCAAARTGELATLTRLTPLLEAWLRHTEAQLHDGLRYSLALRGWRLRLASALPCLIGIRTLALLRQAGAHALLGHVKLPRRAVRQLLLTLVLRGVSDRQLMACWAQAQSPAAACAGPARIGA